MIEKGDKFIILKYGSGIYNCIERHQEVLDKCGYCWFGKIGVSPSEFAIKSKLNPERMLAVLYCQGTAHLCTIIDIATSKPEAGYPSYYEQFLYARNIIPKMYFKLGSIELLPAGELTKCVTMSSGRTLAETVSRSMASFFYGECPEDDVIIQPKPAVEKQRTPKPKAKKKLTVYDKNSCVYRKDGMCTNKRCINYEYDCDRPSTCIKQKPVEKEVDANA